MSFHIIDPPKTLCQSCDNGQVVDFNDGTRKTWCHHGMDTRSVDRPVLNCSVYEQKGKMSEHQAHKIGWVLEGRKTAGFKWTPPKKDED